MSGLPSKIVVVTGAARGIGLACAKALASEVALLLATDIEVAGVGAATLAIGPKAIGRKLTVRAEGAWERGLAEAVALPGRIDILANNVGITGFAPPIGPHDPAHTTLDA